jgi:hypothetical protein
MTQILPPFWSVRPSRPGPLFHPTSSCPPPLLNRPSHFLALACRPSQTDTTTQSTCPPGLLGPSGPWSRPHPLPPSEARQPPSPASRCRVAAPRPPWLPLLPVRDPFLPPLHCSSYPPSTRDLMSFNGLNRHSPPPQSLRSSHRLTPTLSPYKRAPPPPKHSTPQSPLTGSPPFLPLASIGASTAACFSPSPARSWPPHSSPMPP